MSSYNLHQPSWHPYRQNQGDNVQQDGFQSNGSSGMQGSGMLRKYTLPVQDTASQRLGSDQGHAYSSYPASSYSGRSPDMKHMIQMMINLGNQLDRLNELLAQNNQLLQSMHDQEDTKCVQGNGGGAVIVRM